MERIDVRIEHVLEFSIKIVLSILKIGSEPDSVAFPVGFSPGLVPTKNFCSSRLESRVIDYGVLKYKNCTLTETCLEIVILVGVQNLENQFV